MTSQAIVKYETSHGEVSLSIGEIKQLFCSKATDLEARMFLEVCRYQGLNPWLKEAYLIKYQDSEPASIVVGKEVFTKRAQTIEDCIRWSAGVLVARDGVLTEQEGSFLLPGDKLLGGWCRIVRHSSDDEYVHKVALEEYIQTTRDGRPTRFWAKMPATMIRKVALVQGLRECFPESFQGLYDSAEITGGVVEGTARIVPDAQDGQVRVPTVETEPLPTFGQCWEHGVEWITREGRYGLHVFHVLPGEDQWCQFKVAAKAQMGSAWADAHDGEKEDKAINEWLKSRYGGKTWSKLDPGEMLEAIQLQRNMAAGGPPEVDPNTGEVYDPDQIDQDTIEREYQDWEAANAGASAPADGYGL